MSALSALKSIFTSSPATHDVSETVSPIPTEIELGCMDAKWWNATAEERAEYNAMVKRMWKEYVTTHQPTASQLFTRNVLLGRDPKKGFTPISNPTRLKSGHHPHLGWHQAKDHAMFSAKAWEWCSPASSFAEVFKTDANRKAWFNYLLGMK